MIPYTWGFHANTGTLKPHWLIPRKGCLASRYGHVPPFDDPKSTSSLINTHTYFHLKAIQSYTLYFVILRSLKFVDSFFLHHQLTWPLECSPQVTNDLLPYAWRHLCGVSTYWPYYPNENWGQQIDIIYEKPYINTIILVDKSCRKNCFSFTFEERCCSWVKNKQML